MTTLVIDVGNTRLKWGLFGRHGWTAFGATPNNEIGTLAVRDWQNLQRPERVVGVNVAGEAARMRIEVQLARWRLTPQWLVASASACGVTNGYSSPWQLGPDRWAALIAVRQRVIAEEVPTAAVVVNVGTAATVDALDAEGAFRGGVILPGLRLMVQALADKTAALKVAPGEFQDFPINTSDALYSGAVNAVSGAIERMRMRLLEDNAEVKCFIAGGGASEVAPHLNGPLELVDNLVLEGVLVLADSAISQTG